MPEGREEKNQNRKLILINRKKEPDEHFVITQAQLAEIRQMQAEVAAIRHDLDERWRIVKALLENGAEVEPGPYLAWFTRKLVVR